MTLQRAKELFFKDNLDAPTPEASELAESGYMNQAKIELMSNRERHETLSYVEKMASELGYSLKKEKGAYLKSCVKHDILSIPFDIEEAKKSNTLISGTNNTGKSRLACGICSVLKRFDWRLIVFDNSGVWREISDLPFVHTIEGNKFPLEDLDIIYDLSFLTPRNQRLAVDKFFEEYWNLLRRIPKKRRRQTLVVLEEFELYGRNARFSDNLHRAMHVGRNLKLRVLGITTDLALIDPSFIRLCQQRYHGRLGIEENSKRKFRNYYGKDYTRIACEGLGVGDFIYLLNNKLKVVNVPLFEAKTLPKPLNVKRVIV